MTTDLRLRIAVVVAVAASAVSAFRGIPAAALGAAGMALAIDGWRRAEARAELLAGVLALFLDKSNEGGD